MRPLAHQPQGKPCETHQHENHLRAHYNRHLGICHASSQQDVNLADALDLGTHFSKVLLTELGTGNRGSASLPEISPAALDTLSLTQAGSTDLPLRPLAKILGIDLQAVVRIGGGRTLKINQSAGSVAWQDWKNGPVAMLHPFKQQASR